VGSKAAKALTETVENNQYSSWKPARISTHLEKRKLSKSGSVKVQIARLWNDDNKTINKNLKERTARYEKAKDKLEVAIGHPVHKIKSVVWISKCGNRLNRPERPSLSANMTGKTHIGLRGPKES
jgi:hypothetical protein